MPKPTKAPTTASRTKRFSLVPVAAQRQMYETLVAMKPFDPEVASDAEVAEVALCVARGGNDPVILACAEDGARSVKKEGTFVCGKRPCSRGRHDEATLMGVAKRGDESTETALC